MSAEIQKSRGIHTSASNAAADLACPGRHLASQSVQEVDTESDDAAFGRAIHAAMATGDLSKLTLEQADIAESMKAIEEKLIARWFLSAEVKTERERRLWVTAGDMKHSGQLDVFHTCGDRALVLEFKSLSGDIPVASSNLQLRDQAVLLSINNQKLKEIGTVVIQPLATHSPEVCVYATEDIKRASMEMLDRVIASNNPKSKRIPGEVQCKFCRAKLSCKEYQAWAGSMLPTAPSLLSVPVASWTPEQRVSFCQNMSTAQKWLDDAKAAMKELLKKDPTAIPGYGLTDGARIETVVKPEELCQRFVNAGGTQEQFLACVGVNKTKFAEQLNAVTQLKGKKLKDAVGMMLTGLVVESRREGSIERRVDK